MVYTDLADTATSMANEIVNIITIVLSCFAGISLVVSSVMIGIITYVSVVERTQEIGILRSIGAQAGYLQCVQRRNHHYRLLLGHDRDNYDIYPVCAHKHHHKIADGHHRQYSGAAAALAVLLVGISVFLTFIRACARQYSGRKNPVLALRSE